MVSCPDLLLFGNWLMIGLISLIVIGVRIRLFWYLGILSMNVLIELFDCLMVVASFLPTLMK